ncbi:SH3 domain-containing protein [Massilia sp. G4R7]|uniref:SH3 domain-containing protein n=1 Tax=Massilia phyllostachyos TaxID=2898585 RepID=A0ABS8Q674_9BURK|nr:SH3 domain-containing protein [Massilia phyllostachyos]MCD2516466.1 SH3 domain-containing protein [Massilia phyllostachyos]
MSLFLAYGAALLATLCLAAWLTPRSWWRRANARALAVLAGGTLLIGTLLHALFAPMQQAKPAPLSAAQGQLPVPGARYRAWDNLNLRSDVGVGSRRLAVLPAGAQVTASGRHQGDWWEVSATVEGRRHQGWASSLWLRRADEAGSRFFQAHRIEEQALGALGRADPHEAERLVDRHREIR